MVLMCRHSDDSFHCQTTRLSEATFAAVPETPLSVYHIEDWTSSCSTTDAYHVSDNEDQVFHGKKVSVNCSNPSECQGKPLTASIRKWQLFAIHFQAHNTVRLLAGKWHIVEFSNSGHLYTWNCISCLCLFLLKYPLIHGFIAAASWFIISHLYRQHDSWDASKCCHVVMHHLQHCE